MKYLDITLGTCIRIILTCALIVLILIYVHFQARSLIQGPTISLTKAYTPIQHDRALVLEGTAHNIVKLTLNGKEIHTNAAGEFAHTFILENGYTITTLDAQDRFGRKTSIVQEYVYIPLST